MSTHANATAGHLGWVSGPVAQPWETMAVMLLRDFCLSVCLSRSLTSADRAGSEGHTERDKERERNRKSEKLEMGEKDRNEKERKGGE